MNRRTTPEKLPQLWAEIIEKYKDEMVDATDNVVRESGRKAVAALRASSSAVINERYARKWRTIFQGRVKPTIIIHSTSGLPHLLEFGHATSNGGRVAGKPHIAPVEKKVTADFERLLVTALEGKG